MAACWRKGGWLRERGRRLSRAMVPLLLEEERRVVEHFIVTQSSSESTVLSANDMIALRCVRVFDSLEVRCRFRAACIVRLKMSIPSVL